ncbi:peroxisomal succinyl-coenzyme A thioesterase isoform X2 [Maylandia zebra]|uniref:peroxisomal succinyl-coenzyme A thioesterase isoform X2 n=1 Tax=Maylandia zebra TaxID=106582 RepID=UPI00403CEE9C
MISIIFFNLYMPEECLYQKFSVLFVCVCIYMFVCFLTGEVRRKSSFRQSPLLSAAPVRALIDEQISIKGRFLSQNYPVTVCAQMHSEEGDLWEAFAHYTTNASRSINLTSDHSVGGSYLGCEPMGLFWALEPALRSREGLRLRKRNVETPYIVNISLLEGHTSPSEGQSTELAAVTVERWYMAPGVRRIEIRQNKIVGTLFLPPGPGPFPAMLDLWGMGGGLSEYRSALFASRGFASLSVAYMGHKDLPGPPDIMSVADLYFKSAFQLLQDHCQVDADRIGVIGLSFGVCLTLRIATRIGVKPSCLICINGPVGSPLLDEDGKTKTIESDQKHWELDDRGRVSFRHVSLPDNLPAENKQKVKNITCPLMYIVGEDDLCAASTENADVIEEALRSAGKSQLFTRLSYPGAGHLIEPPYAPCARVSLWRAKPEKLFTLWGGHPAPHAAAQEDSWKRILEFMETHLRR